MTRDAPMARDAQMTRQSALPVTMLYMEGRYFPELGNMIEWSTASEQNSDYFEIQISVDGSETDKYITTRAEDVAAHYGRKQRKDATALSKGIMLSALPVQPFLKKTH